MRARYMTRLEPIARALLADLLPELGEARLTLEGGWADPAIASAELAAARDEDTRRGFTTRGPHRADWSITFENAPKRGHLSRGQEKLCALGCILGQARAYADWHDEWPIVCIDDLASELDGPPSREARARARVYWRADPGDRHARVGGAARRRRRGQKVPRGTRAASLNCYN